MATLPLFAAGASNKISSAIDQGVLKYPSYVFCTDTKHFVFIDKNGEQQKIVGDNPQQVEFVTELPSSADAKSDVLYVMNGQVYTYNADTQTVEPSYSDQSATITALQEQVSELDDKVTANEEKVTTLESQVTTLEQNVTNITEGVKELVFATRADFPEIGDTDKLYIDEAEGVFTYDETNGYELLLSTATTGVQFVELDEVVTE